jgi:chemotaxis protein CheD
MKEIFATAFNRKVKILNIGEYYATNQKEGIATVLGSCVSACIYEQGGGIGGMNHFLLPGDFRDKDIFLSPVARYGMFAMELLLGELIKLNADRKKLKAKIFGGAEIMKGPYLEVGKNNIRFIESFLAMENIPIVSSDLGGTAARKIFFFPRTGKVMVKKIRQNMNKIVSIETSYREKARLEI